MDAFSQLANGFAEAITPTNILMAFAGVLIGTVVGVLPGIGSTTGIALLIPLAFGMEPATGLILMAGIYYGSEYGGSTASILVATPGEGSAMMSVIDGYPMAKQGRAAAALATAAIGSFIAGTLGTFGLMLLAPLLAKAALAFRSADYFLLIMLALLMLSSLTQGRRLKGLIAMLLGLAVSTIGIDIQSGVSRFTFGQALLLDGIQFSLVALALFAVPEALRQISERSMDFSSDVVETESSGKMTREDWRRSRMPWLRGSVIGFLAGVLPGVGPTLGSVGSYLTERKLSKHPEEFGKGAIEGVAGPEAANNAGTAGAMVPMFALGVPGSATTAVMLGVFVMYGLQPGPRLFETDSTLVWTVIASMYIGNFILLVLNLPLVGLFAKLLLFPPAPVFAIVLTIAMIGSYLISQNPLDVFVMVGLGVFGYVLRRLDFPIVPAVLAVAMGPLAETNFTRALSIADGNWGTFVDSPLSLTISLAIALFILSGAWGAFKARRSGSERTKVAMPF